MFNKGDIQNGMVVEMNTGERRLCWNGRLIDNFGYIPMEHIDDTLCDIDKIDRQYISKIFLTHDVSYFKRFLMDDSLTCIWDRDKQ